MGIVLAGSLNSIRASPWEQYPSEGEESYDYGEEGETRDVQAEALEYEEATKRRSENLCVNEVNMLVESSRTLLFPGKILTTHWTSHQSQWDRGPTGGFGLSFWKVTVSGDDFTEV